MYMYAGHMPLHVGLTCGLLSYQNSWAFEAEKITTRVILVGKSILQVFGRPMRIQISLF